MKFSYQEEINLTLKNPFVEETRGFSVLVAIKILGEPDLETGMIINLTDLQKFIHEVKIDFSKRNLDNADFESVLRLIISKAEVSWNNEIHFDIMLSIPQKNLIDKNHIGLKWIYQSLGGKTYFELSEILKFKRNTGVWTSFEVQTLWDISNWKSDPKDYSICDVIHACSDWKFILSNLEKICRSQEDSKATKELLLKDFPIKIRSQLRDVIVKPLFEVKIDNLDVNYEKSYKVI